MKRGIKLLGLTLLAALSVMAVTAVGAQAEGKFRVEGKVLAEGVEAEMEGTGGESQLIVPALKLTIQCESVLLTARSDNLNANGTTHSHAKHHVSRHNCLPIGFKGCTIYPTEEDLVAKTNAGLLLASSLRLRKSSAGSHYLVAKTLTVGGWFERIFFGGVFCTLPEEAEITGETAVKFGNATTEATSHTMEDITAKEEEELEVEGLFFNGEPAEMTGDNTSVKLVGKFAGQKYSLD